MFRHPAVLAFEPDEFFAEAGLDVGLVGEFVKEFLCAVNNTAFE